MKNSLFPRPKNCIMRGPGVRTKMLRNTFLLCELKVLLQISLKFLIPKLSYTNNVITHKNSHCAQFFYHICTKCFLLNLVHDSKMLHNDLLMCNIKSCQQYCTIINEIIELKWLCVLYKIQCLLPHSTWPISMPSYCLTYEIYLCKIQLPIY